MSVANVLVVEDEKLTLKLVGEMLTVLAFGDVSHFSEIHHRQVGFVSAVATGFEHFPHAPAAGLSFQMCQVGGEFSTKGTTQLSTRLRALSRPHE